MIPFSSYFYNVGARKSKEKAHNYSTEKGKSTFLKAQNFTVERTETNFKDQLVLLTELPPSSEVEAHVDNLSKYSLIKDLYFCSFLFILHTNNSFSFLLFSRDPPPLSYPTSIHSSENIRFPKRSQQSLTHLVEERPSLSPHASRLSKESHHREWVAKASTRDRPCSC